MKRGLPKYQFPFARYPAVRLALLWASGILIERYTDLPGMLIFCVMAGVMVFLICSGWFFHRTNFYGWYSAFIFTYLILIIMLGMYRFSPHRRTYQMTRLFQAVAGDTVLFHGRIQTKDRSDAMLVYVDSEVINGLPVVSIPFLFRAYGNNTSHFQSGNIVRFRAVIHKMPGKRNPHAFDIRSWLMEQDILAEGRIVSWKAVCHTSSRSVWYGLRNKAGRLVDYCFTGRDAALARAILFGNKKELLKKEKRAFGNAGLSHLMAVSGLHVGFLMVPVWLMLPFFWTSKVKKYGALLMIASLLIFYAGLTGFSASVVRASLTAFFLLTARLFQKMQNPVNLTAVSALIIVIADPGTLFNVSFQLSFSAVFIILLVLPVTDRLIPYKWQHHWYGSLLKIILVSVVVQIGLFPLLAGYFNRFSIVAPLTNAIAVPLTQLAVLWSVPCLITALISPAAGHFLAIPANMMFHLLRLFVLEIGLQHWSWIETPHINPVICLIWIGGIGVVSTCRIPELRWKWVLLLLGSIMFWEGELFIHRLRPEQLKVTLFDVGQGDAILVDTPGNRHFLIDTGPWRPGYSSGSDVIIPELRARGINRLNGVVLTHPHADHIGGMPDLIAAIPIDTIYNCGIQYHSEIYKRYINLAEARHEPVKSLHRGMQLHIDPSIAVLVLAPGKRHGTDPNTSSVVLKILYGHTSFLFTGDAEKPEEERMDRVFGDFLHADFLKVAHHGSKTSTIPVFLNLVHPNVAAVSVGLHNRYGLPSPGVIRRLLSSHARLHYTSFEQALEFTSDGRHISRIQWQSNQN